MSAQLNTEEEPKRAQSSRAGAPERPPEGPAPSSGGSASRKLPGKPLILGMLAWRLQPAPGGGKETISTVIPKEGERRQQERSHRAQRHGRSSFTPRAAPEAPRFVFLTIPGTHGATEVTPGGHSQAPSRTDLNGRRDAFPSRLWIRTWKIAALPWLGA